MLRMVAGFFFSKFSGCSAQERDLPQKFQDAPHGISIFFQIFRMLRTGAQSSSKLLGWSARECDFLQNFQDAPHDSTILNQRAMKF